MLTEELVFENGPPPKNLWLMFLTMVPLISVLPPVKWLILSSLKDCSNIDFITGFRCFYGNIHAKRAFLGDTFFLDYAPIYIGEGTRFSFENIVITATHDRNKWSRLTAKPIVIGKNVWITTRCTLLPGVTIGDNSIIGAGSVVTHDVPSNVFAAGNPCKIIRKLTEEIE